MMQKCWKCKEPTHMNFECTEVDDGGSARKELKKEQKVESVQKTREDMNVFNRKIQDLNETIKNGQLTFYFVKPYAERILNKLLDYQEAVEEVKEAITFSNLYRNREAADQLDKQITSLSKEVRNIYCSYRQATLNPPEYFIAEASYLEVVILSATMVQVMTLRKKLMDIVSALNRRLLWDCRISNQFDELAEFDHWTKSVKEKDPRLVVDQELNHIRVKLDLMDDELNKFQSLPEAEINLLKTGISRIRDTVDNVPKRREALTENLDNIARATSRGAESFLTFIQVNFPCKRQIPSTMGPLRTRIRKQLLAYHPDKQGDYDTDWKIVCQEITNHITSRFMKS